MHIDLDDISVENRDMAEKAVQWLVGEFVRREKERSFGKLAMEFFWEDGLAVTVNHDARDQFKLNVRRGIRRS